ncbi:hypothetical protein SDJN02_15351, partial [Cucurbita argyrosperma subsp. argyrosperma]|uniref:Non-specific lipid-transfer protein 2 n=2 Tax=Cucurbita TaxID=3660 RepID=A0A6J1KNL1_CUCMA
MKASWVAILTIIAVILMSESNEMAMVEAVTCNPMQMSPCISAIISSTPPSKLCCAKIKEQKPCLCDYLKNPSLRNFVDSPNARKVANDCGTPFPTC